MADEAMGLIGLVRTGWRWGGGGMCGTAECQTRAERVRRIYKDSYQMINSLNYNVCHLLIS